MGEKNNALKVYMSRPERIRSVLEYCLKEELPEDWICEDADGFYSSRTRKGKLSFRERDIIKRISMEGESFLLGLENQEKINLIFPWRLMDMDRLTYGQNIEEVQQANVEAGVRYGPEDDYQYRFCAGDRLMPVINLILYWGTEPWRRPKSLADMIKLEAVPPSLRRFFQNYRINLIPVRQIPDRELEKMDSDLKYVVGILKRSGSAKKYSRFIRENSSYFSRIPESAADVIAVYTDIRDFEKYLIPVNTTEGKEREYDMCKALRDLQAEAEKRGEKRGEIRGREIGIEQINSLIRHLLGDGRSDEIERVVSDKHYQEQLFTEYGI